MLTAIRSKMDEMKVISILKRCSDKKTVIKSPEFLFSAVILSNLAHPRPDLGKNLEKLGNG